MPDLFCVSLGIEFTQLRDLRAGFDLSGIDEIGDLPPAFCGKITEL